ncbi:hypothetical protein J19TS2_53040 [Cohnella xylanilytica]|uniref:family 43 glycosylhydrolase n=1 Tax=Cohnella xylanilytica TaxID=557555 RepID=UPI001B2B2A13|nr:family 43 glycosylhydrolase [Cohnella xylanilytica]GIO15749.1 hypothetical protein J19TS2_53040 [Cohnella xylanilytica]
MRSIRNQARKGAAAFVSLLLASSAALSFAPSVRASAAADDGWEQKLRENDYILYFVNAGDPTPATAEAGDRIGLYASLTEQTYGPDPATGKKWGLDTATSATTVRDPSAKTGSLRYYNGPQTRDKALQYRFELPEGDYDVTLGFKNPWSGRSENFIIEGTNVSGDYAIGEYDAEKEVTYRKIRVSDGEMTVRIQGPSSGTLTNYNDPLVNYIVVRQYVVVQLADLQERIDAAKAEAADPKYTPYSVESVNAAAREAEALAASLAESGADIADPAVQERIRAAIAKLEKAVSELVASEPVSSYKPGAVWRDTNGAVIQAHGGGIFHDENTGLYYWYGEDKTNGYLPARGVRVYSSADLYNWKDEGLALTAIESMDDFEDDPLISRLYAGRTDKADILNDIGTNRIIERPKVIYNDKTGKYVMWMHTDGPSATSNANYAKAEAGYALSDSPTGPFVYQESHRMDRAPEDAEYNGQPDQPGMARDMNLFKDDDGTAYLIYSSEENMTIYISKLNEEYTDVVGWHKDGNAERDTTYKAEYGVDYVRVFPGAQREAPAMFKYEGKYYLITSGATGWSPNPAKYTVADSVFGEWRPMRDFAPGTSTTFGSQSTYVIPVDAAAGKFIYMGDRWNSANLGDSRYVWLPIEFGEDDSITLRWYDEWTQDVLDRMGKIAIDTELPEKTSLGRAPELPDTLAVTKSDGTTLTTPVVWTASGGFDKPGVVTAKGRLTQLADKTIERPIYVVPETNALFVHAGGAATSDYSKLAGYLGDLLLNPDAIDQSYDPSAGRAWGYVGNATAVSGNDGGDLFSSLRYLKSNSGDDLTYRFDQLASGRYSVYVGLYDPWYQYSKGNRQADILINGETLTSRYVFTDAKDVLAYSRLEPQNGSFEVTVRRSANAPASNSDPQISWIMIVAEEKTAQQVADGIEAIPAPVKDAAALTLPSVPEGYQIAILSTDSEVIGADGAIAPPAEDTVVQVALQVTRLSDGTTGTATLPVTVPATAKKVTGLKLNEEKVKLKAGESFAFAVTATYEDGSERDVTAYAAYASAKPSVAAVSYAGLLRAIRPGSCEIAVSYRGATAKARANVSSPGHRAGAEEEGEAVTE